MNVVTTGICARSASDVSSLDAWPRMTPFPARTSGRSARLMREKVPGELARERHDGGAFQVRVGHAGGEVRGARPEGGQAHAGVTRQPAPDVRHECRRLLVPDRNEADR